MKCLNLIKYNVHNLMNTLMRKNEIHYAVKLEVFKLKY